MFFNTVKVKSARLRNSGIIINSGMKDAMLFQRSCPMLFRKRKIIVYLPHKFVLKFDSEESKDKFINEIGVINAS